MNFFAPTSTDQSLIYLSKIFGNVGNLLPVTTSSTLLSSVFTALNGAVLILGTILVVYVTVVGVLATAHEGEFMGKKWSGVWVPIRTVMGIVAMFPVSSGYSSLQIIVMWIVLQGVGAADKIWTTALDNLVVMGSAFKSSIIEENSTGVITQQLPKLFNSLTCQATAQLNSNTAHARSPGSTDTMPYYFCSIPQGRTNFCKLSQSELLNITNGPQVHTLDFSNDGVVVTGTPEVSSTSESGVKTWRCGQGYYLVPKASSSNDQPNIACYADRTVNYYMGPDGYCGVLQYANCGATCNSAYGGDPSSLQCLACKAQSGALQSIVTAFGTIAQKFALTDNQYLTWLNTTPISSSYQSVDNTIVPSSLNPQAPTWIANFCSPPNIEGHSDPDKIPANECCYKKIIPLQRTCTTPIPGAQPICTPMSGTGTPLDCTATKLFTDNPVDAENNDYYNANGSSIKNAYIPYSLKPFLTDIDFLDAAKKLWYSNVIVGPTTTWRMTQGPQKIMDWMKKAKGSGWIFAGGFYYDFVGYDSAVSTVPPLSVTFTVNGQNQESMSFYRNNYNAAGAFAKAMHTEGENLDNEHYNEINSVYQNINGAMFHGMMHTMTGNTENPLQSLAFFGQQLMQATEIAWTVLAVTIPIMVGALTANFIALGTGMPVTWWGEAIKAFFGFITPYFLLLFAAMFSLGALLSIYVPMIPYMVFTLSALGWFIGVIEAMVAAPFVALGILSPAGQHELLGRAEPAVMMILNLFLRPALMVVGLIAAMLLASVAVQMVNAGFTSAMASVTKMGGHGVGTSLGPFEQIIWIAVYTTFIVTVLNKCFSLIHFIPERVLTWIGGQAISYGEQEGLHEAKGVTQSAGGAAGGGMKEGIGSGAQRTEGAPEKGAQQHERKQAADKAKTATVSGATPSDSGT